MAQPTTLSAVIITFNEEKNIERCLDSLDGLVDEIIVVDSFSTDATKEMCLRKGVQFVEHPFEGHIEQKNYAASLAQSDYILSLDADEALTEGLRHEIEVIKPKLSGEAYSLPRLTNYCGKWIAHCGWYPDRKIRLWKKGTGNWGGKNPHDRMILEPNTPLKELKNDLLHYSFYTVQQHLKQISFFTDISSQAAFESGKKSSLVKILFNPFFKFIRDYILLRGFLDGYYGLIICLNSAFAKYLKYLKLRELNKANN